MSHTTNIVSVGTINTQPGSGYVASFVQSFVPPESTVSRVARDTDAPIVTHVAQAPRVYYLQVLVEDAEPDVVDARRRAILREFDSVRGPLTVVIENATGTARRRFMQFVVGRPSQVEGQLGSGFMAPVESYDGIYWQSIDEAEHVFTLNETADVQVTVAGDLDVHPTYTLTPNADKTTSNWPYSKVVFVEWRSPHGGWHSIDIAGEAGLDTAALVTAGKVTDGSNISVIMNGVLTRHWYQADGNVGAFNRVDTQLWIDMEFWPSTTPYLNGYVSATDTTWPVDMDAGLGQTGTLRVDDEIVSYTSRSPGYIYGVQRGQWGTTAATHNADEIITIYQGVAFIAYGPNAVAPENMKTATYRAAQPPMMLTPGSTNLLWRYDEFSHPARRSSWVYIYTGHGLGYFRESDGNGFYDTSQSPPWTAIGLDAGTTSTSLFELRLAVPVKAVHIIGRRALRFQPPATYNAPTLEARTQGGAGRIALWSSATGVSSAVSGFEYITPDIRPLDYRGYNLLYWMVSYENYVQADIQTMVIALDDSYTPVVTLGDEQTEYDLDLVIQNLTTGETLSVQLHNMAVGHNLIIDTEARTVTYSLDGSSKYYSVRRNASRPRLLRLVPGVNTLRVTEVGMGELELTVRYRPQWYT